MRGDPHLVAEVAGGAIAFSSVSVVASVLLLRRWREASAAQLLISPAAILAAARQGSRPHASRIDVFVTAPVAGSYKTKSCEVVGAARWPESDVISAAAGALCNQDRGC